MRGSLADVIFPKPGVPTVPPGPLKLTLLNMLKNSARNCTLMRSVMLVVLSRPTLVLNSRGPFRMFLPELPNVPTPLNVKSDVSKKRSTISACDSPLSLAWLKDVPVKSARSMPAELNELSAPVTRLKGKPLCHVVTEVSSQPFASLPAAPCIRGTGMSQIPVK